ncbi:hypothetical protein A9Q83_09495 [Alphaproteobacteria bacterium 46_93_T64]|nr:hypothetical protein A9Q83_09495 [Alphaproteobacteria bacterium 46_93_T64]
MKTILFIATSVLLISSNVSASTFNSSQFLGIDRDASNEIDEKEAVSFRKRYFSGLDLDGNGTVEFEEYVKANKLRSSVSAADAPVPVTDEYKEADKNADTILTLDEFLAIGSKRFQLLDKDKNGSISREEFVSPGL